MIQSAPQSLLVCAEQSSAQTSPRTGSGAELAVSPTLEARLPYAQEFGDPRKTICTIARTWIGTPWRHRARIKGAGVDCAMLVAEIYIEAGLIPAFEIEEYPPDWHLHRDEERYLTQVLAHAHEISIAAARPGDLVLVKIGRAFAHGAIISELGFPHVIHAFQPARCVLEGVINAGMFEGRPLKCFTVFDMSEGA